MDIGAGITFGNGVSVTKQPPPPNGQQAYTTAGTFSWTAPTGVTSVCVVTVGGGGSGANLGGGGGGGLGWKNNITVVPGQSYTVLVGYGGSGGTNYVGGQSYFIDATTVKGGGGIESYWNGSVFIPNGGSYVGDGGGNGGSGYSTNSSEGVYCGGGGAGGYAGNGGIGGSNRNPSDPTAGNGGGGGGGMTTGGGGVGILGQGTSGAAFGIGGSGGASGIYGGNTGVVTGGLYGGGGFNSNLGGSSGRTQGAGGAVRIIWGDNRAFPSTNTIDVFDVPGAPTVGTATATSDTTATVTFTQPANDGGTTITSYTATSSPAGGTGTLSQAGSGTITVSGLTGSTSYTFTVTATNSAGTSSASAASNSAFTAPTVIGQAWGGGYYAGQISTSGNGVANYYLVVAPVSSGDSSKQWKTTNTSTAGTDSVIDGPTNSSNMNNASHPAAQFCEAVTAGGFSDWYMPAKNELEVCFYNLKPYVGGNNTSSGINPNAVPARASNYTSSVPAQTSAAAFQSGGAEAFNSAGFGGIYFSSTQANSSSGWTQGMYSGYQRQNIAKTGPYRVRAVRRLAV